jgi:hypothetical protein
MFWLPIVNFKNHPHRKKISTLLQFALVFVILQTANAQERNVFFVHGLCTNGTGKNAWIKYDQYFNSTRKVRPYRFQYGQNGSVTAAAAVLRQQMADSVAASTYPNNFVIAHSQGGIVTRTIAKDYPGSQLPFGGFITIGAPNLGAPVINAYQAGLFAQFSADASTNLLAGPTSGFLDNWITAWIPGWANSKLSHYIEKKIESESAITNPTTLDYFVGAPHLNQLSAHISPVPKIGITSAESTPLSHWKTLSSYTLEHVTDLPLNQVADTKLEGYIQKAYNFYKSRYDYFELRASMALLPGRADYFRERANKWRQGMTWINTSENKYLTLIGVVQITQSTYVPPACPPPCTTMDCINGNNGCAFNPQQNPIIVNQVTVLPSDGIVPLSNQVLPGALQNFQLAGGINHAQQRNHPAVTSIFDSIMDGQTGNTNPQMAFFMTPKL